MLDDRLPLNARTFTDERLSPSESFVEQANVTADELSAFSGREGWKRAAAFLDWDEEFDRVFEESSGEFFAGGKLNAAANCLDRHLDERKNQRALVWEGQRGECRTYTYLELFREVNAVAAGLRSLGVGQGDAVTLYMPVVPELPVTMLACARLGAPHVVVFAGFSAEALATRMREAESAVLVTCDGYYRRGDAVSLRNRAETACVSLPDDVTTVVVDHLGTATETPERNSHRYNRLRETHAGERVDPVVRESAEELFYIYTSGTTGTPKRVTHTTGGYLSHAAWTSHAVLDIKPADTYWCPADIGWITGHTYVVYGPLALGTTVLLSEAGIDGLSRTKPWELIERHAVDIFYTSPTAVRTFVKAGSEYPDSFDLSSLRLLGTVGEPINLRAWRWLYEHVGGERCPVVDTWWQTETGGHLITTVPGVHEMKPGSAGVPLPGIEAAVLDRDGRPAEAGSGGYLVITEPWPGMARELSRGERWAARDDEAVPDLSAFEWAYPTEDGAVVDETGYITVLGRVDDVLNVSGHRFGTMELESAIVDIEGVAEAAVVDAVREGQRVMDAYVSLTDGATETEMMRETIFDTIEGTIGEFARPARVVFTPALPKTSSGKIVRRVLTDVGSGEEVSDTSAVANPEVVGEIRSSLNIE